MLAVIEALPGAQAQHLLHAGDAFLGQRDEALLLLDRVVVIRMQAPHDLREPSGNCRTIPAPARR